MKDEHPEKSQNLGKIGGPIDRVTVSLRLFGEDLDPDEISRLLGCEPSVGYVKGEETILSNMSNRKRIARTGSWQLKSDTDRNVELEEQIDRLLSRVTAEPLIWASLIERYDVDLFCGLFLEDENREFALSAAVLQEVAERKLSIRFDVYAVFEEREDEQGA